MKGSILLSVALISILGFSTFAKAEDKLPDTATKNYKVEHKKSDFKMAKHTKKVKHHKHHKHCKKCHCTHCHHKHCHCCKHCHCKKCHCKHCHRKCCHHRKHKSHPKPVDKLDVKITEPVKPVDPNIGNEKPAAKKVIVETKSVVADSTANPAKPIISTDVPATASK